ncbi:hypothetical protein AVEN_240546-1 [Araneus ventricosus]|uniref:Uncharacterized protein n=1 Tax=Araneus ventricosus TaxID=182803 RepID=A0A4Y2T9G8_ARAVE|nr:hypothetical protein AVEN_240546-1 [Araneus ventricosus]
MHICLFAASETVTSRNLTKLDHNIISEAVPGGGIRGRNNRIFVDDIIPHEPVIICHDLENFILQYLDFSSLSFCSETPDRGREG